MSYNNYRVDSLSFDYVEGNNSFTINYPIPIEIKTITIEDLNPSGTSNIINLCIDPDNIATTLSANAAASSTVITVNDVSNISVGYDILIY